MSKYPAQIDTSATLPLVADNSSPVAGSSVNRLRNAIIAIEKELGVKPSGIYTTVRARLDYLEDLFNLDIVTLNGDLGGTTASPLVIGLQNRPVSSQSPNTNDVLSWNGSSWVPAVADNVVVNVIPTSISLPADIAFLAGDGYVSNSTPTRVGARIIDFDLYPSIYPDGRSRILRFVAELETTASGIDGYVRLKDVTNNIVINNSTLQTSTSSPIEVSILLQTGTVDGYLRSDVAAMYELQIFKTGAAGNLVCRNARIEVTYTPAFIISALIPLALPTDINFIAGINLNGFGTPAAAGRRKIDMSKFPNTLPDGRQRVVEFITDVEVSTIGVDGYIQLFDITNNVLITGTNFNFTNTLANELSATLTVGSSNGQIRVDSITKYEVRLWKISGSPSDRVICSNARVMITYV